MRLLLLILILLPNIAFGAAYTSTQSGNWNDSATWGGGGFPAAGDTATIATTHTVTVTANAAVGTGGSTGTDELTIIGTLVVGAFTLTVDGDTQINNGTLQLNAGATMSIDGTYEIEFTNTATLDINGTSGSRCEISAIASNFTWVDGAANGSIINIDADYCDFIRFGDGTNRSFDINGASATQTINFQNCLFDDFSRLDVYNLSRPNTDSQLKFINCDFRTMPSSFAFVIGSGSTWSFDANTHLFDSCTFAGNSSGSVIFVRLGSGSNPYLFTDNISEQCEWRITNNFNIDGFFHVQDSGLQTVFNCQAPTIQATVENGVAWGDYTNIHLFASDGAGGTLFQDNISFSEEPSGFGNHYLPSEADNTTVVRRCVAIGDNLGIIRSSGTPTTSMYQNTHISNDSNADDLFLIETPGYTGTFTGHSNIEYSLSPNNRLLFDDLVGSGLGAASTLDYNCIYDNGLTGRYDVTISGKSVGDTGFGESDIAADPKFNNKLATIQTWDTSLGGGGTVNGAIGELLKLNGFDRSGASAVYDTDYSISAALTYFRNAFTPTNTALKGTGSGGVDMGALPVSTGVTAQAVFF